MKGAIIELSELGFPWKTEDPFLFCVHHDDRYPAGNADLGPAASLAGRALGEDFAGIDGWRMYHGQTVPGFPQHPHRGFETVTVVRRGLVDHADSLGAAARYGAGDVQWLTAGGGIVHSEMFPLLERGQPNPLDLFQIWLNLPSSQKLVPAYFSMAWDHQVPRVAVNDSAGRRVEITLAAGALAGHHAVAPPPDSWAARVDNDVAIWTIRLGPRATWTLPPAASARSVRTLYFFDGSMLRVGETALERHLAIKVASDIETALEAGHDGAELLLLQGRPIGEPVVQYGPFVMNTRAEIHRAFMDYQLTRFGGWPWDADDPVHGATEGRFARHADGRTERPER